MRCELSGGAEGVAPSLLYLEGDTKAAPHAESLRRGKHPVVNSRSDIGLNV